MTQPMSWWHRLCFLHSTLTSVLSWVMWDILSWPWSWFHCVFPPFSFKLSTLLSHVRYSVLTLILISLCLVWSVSRTSRYLYRLFLSSGNTCTFLRVISSPFLSWVWLWHISWSHIILWCCRWSVHQWLFLDCFVPVDIAVTTPEPTTPTRNWCRSVCIN